MSGSLREANHKYRKERVEFILNYRFSRFFHSTLGNASEVNMQCYEQIKTAHIKQSTQKNHDAIQALYNVLSRRELHIELNIILGMVGLAFLACGIAAVVLSSSAESLGGAYTLLAIGVLWIALQTLINKYGKDDDLAKLEHKLSNYMPSPSS